MARRSPIQSIPHDVKMLLQEPGIFLKGIVPSKNNSGKHYSLNLIHLSYSVFMLLTQSSFLRSWAPLYSRRGWMKCVSYLSVGPGPLSVTSHVNYQVQWQSLSYSIGHAFYRFVKDLLDTSVAFSCHGDDLSGKRNSLWVGPQIFLSFPFNLIWLQNVTSIALIKRHCCHQLC